MHGGATQREYPPVPAPTFVGHPAIELAAATAQSEVLGPVRGRAAELEAGLRALRAAMAGGRGTVITVAGGSRGGLGGVGVTTVVSELVARASRMGYAVGAATASDPGDRTVSVELGVPMHGIAPLLSALRSPVHPLLRQAEFLELGALHDRPLWFLDRLAVALESRAAACPVLVALDDVHQVDSWTSSALQVLPARLASSPVVWLLGSRIGGPIDDILEAARGRTSVTQVDLQPLPTAAIDEVAVDVLGHPPTPELAALLRTAGGVPRLSVRLLEEVAAGADPSAPDVDASRLPAGFLACLRERLASTLSAESVKLLQVGSVLEEFTLEDVAALAGVAAWQLVEPLQAAVRAGHLLDDGDQIRFALPLVRRGVYQELPTSARRLLHRLGAEHLAANDGPPLAIAGHLLASGGRADSRTVDTLRRAARLVAAADPSSAVGLLRAAHDMMSAPHDAATRDLLLERDVEIDLIQAMIRTGHHRDALTLAECVGSATAERTPASAGVGPATSIGGSGAADPQVLVAAAPAYLELGCADELIQRAGAILRSDCGGPSTLALRAIYAASQLASRVPTGQAPDEEALQLLRSQAQSADDEAAVLWSTRALAVHALAIGRPDVAASHFAAISTSLGQLCVLEEIDALVGSDDLRGARERIRVFETAPEVAANPARRAMASTLQARLQLALGGLDQAATLADAALLRPDSDAPLAAATAALVAAEAALLQGRVGDASRALDRLRELPATPAQRLQAAVLRTRVVTVGGKPPAVAAHLSVDVLLAAEAARRSALDALVEAVRLALSVDARETATALACCADADDAAAGSASDLRLVQLSGLLADDTDRLAFVAESIATSNQPLRRAAAAEDLGRALLATGQVESAVIELDRAWDCYAGVGATAAARHVQRTLRAAGIRRQRWITAAERPSSGWSALTEAERRVADLIASGCSNRQAAERLVVSPNTVASHLRSVYAKLGVSSRVQLARLDRDQHTG